MLHSRHNPATFDLTGMSEAQFDALRTGLLLVYQAENTHDHYSEGFERVRLGKIAAAELIEATNAAMPQADGNTNG